jgi:hypothetical protein
MEVPEAIHELRASLEYLTSEEDLLAVIGRGLASLRAAFAAHREEFSAANIEFLRGLAPISEALRRFVVLKGDLPAVADLVEYESAVNQLVAIRDALAGLPVAGRPAGEIRALSERLPEIRGQEVAQRRFRLDAGAPLCRMGHPMFVRQGSRGHFWGCSQFPFCRETVQLTPGQAALLS